MAIFVPHAGCPHQCAFCDQKSISGSEKAPTAKQVFSLLEEQADNLAQKGMTAEIAFFGGSFTAIPRDYMLRLLDAAKTAMDRFPVYTGIRCSTRPDRIDEKIVDILKRNRVTAVELGAQSMSDAVLRANSRGHTAEDVRRASALIKESGIELGLQMMTGLYQDSERAVLMTAEEFVKIAPATVRIYPTVILENTRLGELFKRGEYQTFSFEQTVGLCARLLKIFEENHISVIRMGLHASPEVERKMLGGVYHPSFREIVESRLLFDELAELLKPLPKGGYTVFTDRKNVSRVIGQKRENLIKLNGLGYDIKVKERAGERLSIAQNEGI